MGSTPDHFGLCYVCWGSPWRPFTPNWHRVMSMSPLTISGTQSCAPGSADSPVPSWPLYILRRLSLYGS